MGKKSRDKGARIERAIVKILQDHGLCAERVPLSGQGAIARASDRFGGDVHVPVLGQDERIEVKARSSGFAMIYGWLEGNYGLVIKADRKDPLIVLRLSDAARVLECAEHAKAQFLGQDQ
ncbi:hypothetical protein V5G24_20235 [Xanthobacter sp. VTT E-85241]|uniref:putative PDDEXK endonuclease n=1 Tax=Roseixanthobacter finlandensis TaxID=3119922 RepID=UPI00372C519C